MIFQKLNVRLSVSQWLPIAHTRVVRVGSTMRSTQKFMDYFQRLEHRPTGSAFVVAHILIRLYKRKHERKSCNCEWCIVEVEGLVRMTHRINWFYFRAAYTMRACLVIHSWLCYCRWKSSHRDRHWKSLHAGWATVYATTLLSVWKAFFSS